MPRFKVSGRAVAIVAALPMLAAIVPPTAVAQTAKDEKKAAVVLTPAEIAEREGRKACKVAICAGFHNRKADGSDIACNVVKTWRKETLNAMVSKAKVSWPWGPVTCTADVKVKRDLLIRAMTEDKYEAQLDQHHVVCEVEQEKGPSKITFDFKPKVTFEKGKATKAALNWGKIDAPALVKGAMWTATATDNTFNVLQGSMVEDINDFITTKCDEVKADWQGK